MCVRVGMFVCGYSLVPEAAAPLAVLLAAAVGVVVRLVVQRTDEVLIRRSVRHHVRVVVLTDLRLCERKR